MATKKYLSLERLTEYDELIKGEIANGDASTLTSAKSYTDSAVSGKANVSHTHSISDVTNLQATLDGKVPTSRTVNGKALSANITLSASDVGADASGSADAVQTNLDTHTSNANIHVTTTNKSNWNSAYSHSTSAHAPSNAEKNIIVGIQKNGTDLTVDSSTRKVNITVPTTAADIGAAASSHNHSASNITSGTLAIARGGTGATDASGARTNLDVYSTTEVDSKVSTAVSGLASTSSVNTAISTHNSSTSAHSDIRETLAAVKEDVDAFFKDATISTEAKDTLKEIQDYITSDASAAAEMTASIAGKADKATTLSGYGITNAYTKTEVDTALSGKANSSHGTHVTFDSTNKPKMDGTAAFGTSTKVARADHVHPTDTSRASKTEFDTHVADTTKHITSTERTNWGAAYTHSQAAHAPSNAEKNQNAFSNITVGETTIAADTTTDTLTLVGSNVTITPDATNDKITIAVASGSTSAAGIVKLTNSTSSTSTTTAATPNSVKSAYDLANQAKTAAATAQSTADGKANASHTHVVADITDLTATVTELNYMDGVTSNVQTQLDGKAASSHSHSAATTSDAGFMTAAMVTKLNGIATGATKNVVDSALSSSSTNPVQNKVINSALTTLTSTVSANTSSISSHSTAISNLQTAVSEIQEITSEEIQALFA